MAIFVRKYPKIRKSALPDVADARGVPETGVFVLQVEFGWVRPQEKSKLPIPVPHDGHFRLFFTKIRWILLHNSPRTPKSAHRDVADARDGPGSPTVALYVGFGWARPREKSKIPIPGSDDGEFRQQQMPVFARKRSKTRKSALPDVAAGRHWVLCAPSGVWVR